jgi:hypothetical protein
MCDTDWQGSFNSRLCKLAFREYKEQKAKHMQRGRSIRTFQYVVPQWQADAIDAMARNDEESAKANIMYR